MVSDGFTLILGLFGGLYERSSSCKHCSEKPERNESLPRNRHGEFLCSWLLAVVGRGVTDQINFVTDYVLSSAICKGLYRRLCYLLPSWLQDWAPIILLSSPLEC